MFDVNNHFSNRDKGIIVGLFLSKFNEEALRELGFDGFTQAFNTLGYAIGVKPASIKNYRDEFDPYFPNARQGRHKRPMRDYCKLYFNEFAALSFGDFTGMIKEFIIPAYEMERVARAAGSNESVARRLITGRAAEEYFKEKYPTISQFHGYELKDTTNLACGFDFKMLFGNDFYCVEVKGLNLKTGSVQLTEKEFGVASELKQRYCLFVVRNFAETPEHQTFFDPLNCGLSFRKTERKVTQINYLTTL